MTNTQYTSMFTRSHMFNAIMSQIDSIHYEEIFDILCNENDELSLSSSQHDHALNMLSSCMHDVMNALKQFDTRDIQI